MCDCTFVSTHILANLYQREVYPLLIHTKQPKCVTTVGFEILTAVVMKSSIFRDITLCSPLRVNR
jgi:hypothetical protein